MWWSNWYQNAAGAVSGSVTAAENTIGSLFKSPPNSQIQADDAAVDPNGPFLDLSSDPPVSDAPATAPPKKTLPTWDEMPWYSKLWTYGTDIVPGAVADTVGLGRNTANTETTDFGHGGAETPISVGTRTGAVVKKNAPVIGGFLQTTLTKTLIGLVLIVVGLLVGYAIIKKVMP